MARRWLGSIVASTKLVPSATQKSGMFALEELSQIQSTTVWYPLGPVLTATTFSTADAGSYTFTAQPIGDAHHSKVVYVAIASLAVGTTGNPTVTIAGSAAQQIVNISLAITQADLGIWAARIESATTTANIVMTLASTRARAFCHTFSAYGVDKVEAIATTAQAYSTVPFSSGETISQDIPPGAFVLSAMCVNSSPGIGSTGGFATGSTNVAKTSAGTEAGYFASAITDWTTAQRNAHSITTTHSTVFTGGGFVVSAVFK